VLLSSLRCICSAFFRESLELCVCVCVCGSVDVFLCSWCVGCGLDMVRVYSMGGLVLFSSFACFVCVCTIDDLF
jgi:hypothetical protein